MKSTKILNYFICESNCESNCTAFGTLMCTLKIYFNYINDLYYL